MSSSSSQDTAKLHSEINQYINQKLVIINIAVTVFGVIMGWFVAGISPAKAGGARIVVYPVSLLLPTMLLAILVIMLWYIEAINKQMHILSTYLTVTRSSIWETHYQSFIKPTRPGIVAKFAIQDDMAYLVFAALGVVTIMFSWIVNLLYRNTTSSAIEGTEFALFMATLGSILFFLYKYRTRKLENFRQKVKKHWIKCIKGHAGFAVDQCNS